MPRILLIEDDALQVRAIRRAFKSEYSIDAAGCAADAVRMVRAIVYDVVLLDWLLPDDLGPDVLRRMRQEIGVTSPVLMLTARDSVDDKVQALEFGADDYLVKPFDLRELRARIAALIRRGSGEPGMLRVGEVSVHLKSQEVYVGSTPVSLTHLELCVLILLMEHVGVAVPRSRILAAVWGASHLGMSNVVDVHMARLRGKLGDAGRQIETLRGVGYRMRPPAGAPDPPVDR